MFVQMSNHRRSLLILSVLVVSLAFIGFVNWTLDHIERERWKVHSSEQRIADRILALGGNYLTRSNNGKHITYVILDGTNANDRDVETVLQLKHIEWLDLVNCPVTDACLDNIIEHPSLKRVSVTPDQLSRPALEAARKAANWRVLIDEVYQ
jgi:hypothetical protein